ncbi:MAG: Dolichyl-phosphate-mannose-protein mannosyltransferase-domain-containing protein [Podila humilis]|nr:MAG: Dolichyl-phosphate-mannose-protein mannosyltransferase-domain-containing protein [Podila humilis]
MAKGHSRKKSLVKQPRSAHPDIFAKEGPTTSSSSSPTALAKTSESLKQRSSVATLLNEGLEDLDHDLNEDTSGAAQEQGTFTQSNKPTKHPGQQDSSPTSPSSFSTSSLSTGTINHVSFWTWLTASRVASNLQLLEEQREERYHYLAHQKRYASSKRGGEKKDNDLGQDDETEFEKKLAKHSWDMAKVYRAYDMTGKDWAVLGTLTIMSLSVRMWHINVLDRVILGEGHMGNYINSYLKKEYSFDVHPPLGKLVLTEIAKRSKYNGSHIFDGIGSEYPSSLPFTTMRVLTATMGALVPPMAFMTLKSSGQSVSTATMAALLITLDNALTTHSRLIALDSPLLFFSALSILSWNMFNKHSPRWWSWLLITGVAVGGAMSTKLSGALTAVTVLLLAVINVWQLAGDESVNGLGWIQHLVARVGALIVLPMTIYLALFHVHFSLQINQPDPSISLQAAYDLNALPLSYRGSLIPPINTPKDDVSFWRDVAYGSVIQLTSEASPQMHLHSIPDALPYALSSGQQQVAGYAHSDLNTHWLVTRAETTPEEPLEIPLRLQYLKNGDTIKLRHLTSRRVLHSHAVRPHCCPVDTSMCEVTAYSGKDENDHWVVEVVEPNGGGIVDESNQVPVIALETMIRLRHVRQDCHLYVRNNMLAPGESWGYGRQEIVCLKETKATAHRAMWRITHNVHDFLPLGTKINVYPKLSFRQKLRESHRMMWSQLRAVETEQTPAAGVSSKPWQWPLAQAMVLAWVGDQGQQVTITANSVVWWASTLGLAVFIVASAMFLLRQQRGYLERGHTAALKNFHLRDARVYFAAWAISFTPFLVLNQPRAHVFHHYFPALYFAILVSCSVFSGITAFLPRGARLALHIGFISLVAGMFTQLAPITYGTPMDANQCRALDQWLAKTIRLHTSSFLDCSFDPSYDQSVSPPHVGKAYPVEKRPVLKAYYPHPDVELPDQDAYFLMPFQRPPQQWMKSQMAKPDVHQIQMLKARLGQKIDWTTFKEDRMDFQKWIEKEGVDPWNEKRRAEEEKMRKLKEEEEQRTQIETRRTERRRIKEEKKRAKQKQKAVEEEQKRVVEEQRRASEETTIAEKDQEAQKPSAEKTEEEVLGALEKFRLALKNDHEELRAAPAPQESQTEDQSAEQISEETKEVQGSEPIDVQHAVDDHQSIDASPPSDDINNNLDASVQTEAQKPTKKETVAKWIDKQSAASIYAAKIHNEAGGYAQFRAPEEGDFPLAGSGLKALGLGQLKDMDADQLKEFEEQVKPMMPLVKGMFNLWSESVVQKIKSGELKMIRDETGAWKDVSENKVDTKLPLNIMALLARTQGQAQGQAHVNKPKAPAVDSKKPKTASDQAPKAKSKKPKVPDAPKPAQAQKQEHALDVARKAATKAMEQMQTMRKARKGKNEVKAKPDLGFVPVTDGKDEEEQLRLLKAAFVELAKAFQKTARDELEARRKAKG